MKKNKSTERPRVLHVVERMGGGLADAMISYARGATDFEHHLLYAQSNDASFLADELDCYASVTEFERGHFSRIRQVTALSKQLGAEFIHGHSAFGGFYARLARSNRRVSIAYTPHSFPFERLSAPTPVRAAFYAIEWLLARNTTLFIACSRREEQLSRRLSARAQTAFVVNVGRVPPAMRGARPANGGGASAENLLVIGAGRIMMQKGTSTFARIAREVMSVPQVPTTDFVWIGDGSDDSLKDELRDAGVSITGWLDRTEVLKLMSRATLYVHTALWEGFPIVLLESVAVGTPIAVVNRPYAAGLPEEAILIEEGAHERVSELLASAALRDAALRVTSSVFEENTAQNQSSQLNSAYRAARLQP